MTKIKTVANPLLPLIMVDERNEPVVMDFGLAYRSTEGEERLTHSGTIMGTPAYMPPEQVDGDIENIGAAADIYSLGVILYEWLTGKLPFSGKLMSILNQIANDDPKPPSTIRKGIDPALEKICLKMMAKQIEDRYESMDKVASDLGKYLKQRLLGTDTSTTIKPDASIKKSKPKKSRATAESTQQLSVSTDDEFDEAASEEYIPFNQRTANPAASRKSNTPVLIACGVAGVLLLAVVFLITRHNSESTNPTSNENVAAAEGEGDELQGDGEDPDGRQTPETESSDSKVDFDATNYALQFDGDTYVTIRGLHRTSPQPITVEAFIRAQSPRTDGPIFSGLGISLFMLNGKLKFYAEGHKTSGSASMRLALKDRLPRLQHVAGVWDGRTARLFVDGLEGTTDAKSLVDHGELWTKDFVVGKGENRDHYTGVIDELRISKSVRYDDSFVPPRFNDRWTVDESTLILVHFDDSEGRTAVDAAGNADSVLITNPNWLNLRSQRPLPIFRRFRNGRP